MALLTRYLQAPIESDLGRKMVFVGGPRQAGKTQLGKLIIPDPAAYLNYDIAEHRRAILKGELPATPAWGAPSASRAASRPCCARAHRGR